MPYIVKLNAGSWIVDFNQGSLYFRIGIGFWILFTLVSYLCGVWKQIRYKAGIIGTAAWICSLPVFVYIGYFLVYGSAFSSADMLPILHTTWKEATGYISDQIGLEYTAVSVLMVFLYGGFCWGCSYLDGKQYAPDTLNKKWYIVGGVFITGAVYLIIHNMFSCFPLLQYRDAIAYEKLVAQFQQNRNTLLQNFKIEHPDNSLNKNLPGTVLVVIGESACRDHIQAFNPNYPASTSPWMNEVKENEDFFFYSHAYGNYPVTIPTLSMFLTGMNQYNGKSLTSTVSIMDAARAAGYQTWWISNQSRLGGNDTPTTVIAESADHTLWTTPSEDDDKNILPLLQNINGQENSFVIIHLMGSHMQYYDRVPVGFSELEENYGANKKTVEYDRSLRYTDDVLKDIFAYAHDHLNLQAMIYCSDHGEDMEYGHGSGKFTFNMVRIPMFIYLSPAYQNKYPQIAENIRNHEDRIFTNDLMYDTISGILQIPNSEYDSRWDLTSTEYDLPVEMAKTKHGEISISDDI